MKRKIMAGVAILGIAAGVGWKVSSHPETSAGLKDIGVIQGSERSYPGPSDALAGVRIRLSPSNWDDHMLASAHEAPRIPLVAK